MNKTSRARIDWQRIRTDLAGARAVLIDKILNQGLLNEEKKIIETDLGDFSRKIEIFPTSPDHFFYAEYTGRRNISIIVTEKSPSLMVGLPNIPGFYRGELNIAPDWASHEIAVITPDPECPTDHDERFHVGVKAFESIKNKIARAALDLRLIKQQSFYDKTSDRHIMPFRYRSSDYRIVKPEDSAFETVR